MLFDDAAQARKKSMALAHMACSAAMPVKEDDICILAWRRAIAFKDGYLTAGRCQR